MKITSEPVKETLRAIEDLKRSIRNSKEQLREHEQGVSFRKAELIRLETQLKEWETALNTLVD